jgi:hypothetical protein
MAKERQFNVRRNSGPHVDATNFEAMPDATDSYSGMETNVRRKKVN